MKTNKIVWIVIIIVVLGGVIYALARPAKASPLDGFAQCIKDSGTLFYGAFWCPHCREQKAEFGGSATKLPYIECSTPDGNGQTQVCIDKQIQSYPTWFFPDGTKSEGVQPLQTLADKTKCQLPASQ